MPRLLVFGAGGFLGEHLVHHFSKIEDYHVIGLGRGVKPLDFPVEWMQADILDLPLLESIIQENDVVINASGMVSYNPSDDNAMIKVNEEGTANLVIACQKAMVAHFIHISSVAVFGQRIPGDVMDEKSIWIKNPENTQYAISKFKGEQQVWQGIHEGLKATILNPGFMLGEFSRLRSSLGIIGHIYKQAKFHPRGSNGFVDVADVVKAVTLVLNGDFAGQRFIINGVNLSYAQLYQSLSQALKVKNVARPLPSGLDAYLPFLDRIRSMFSGQKRIIFADTVKASRQNRIYKNDKSKSVLGLAYTDFSTTLARTADSFYKSLDT